MNYKGLDKHGGTACENNIINIQKKDQTMRTNAEHKCERINVFIHQPVRKKKMLKMKPWLFEVCRHNKGK